MKKIKQPSNKLLNKYMDLYWKIESVRADFINSLEIMMSNETGISDIEFIFQDGYAIGIGNTSRTMEMWQPEEVK